MRCNASLKHQDPITHWYSIVSQTNSILNCAILWTSELIHWILSVYSIASARVPANKPSWRASTRRICCIALCSRVWQQRPWNSQLREVISLVWSRNTIHWVTQECGLLTMDVRYIWFLYTVNILCVGGGNYEPRNLVSFSLGCCFMTWLTVMVAKICQLKYAFHV